MSAGLSMVNEIVRTSSLSQATKSSVS